MSNCTLTSCGSRSYNIYYVESQGHTLVYHTKSGDILSSGTMKSAEDTTKKKKEFHGYGLKSLQYTVHKYNGEVDINLADNWFDLKILIPM